MGGFRRRRVPRGELGDAIGAVSLGLVPGLEGGEVASERVVRRSELGVDPLKLGLPAGRSPSSSVNASPIASRTMSSWAIPRRLRTWIIRPMRSTMTHVEHMRRGHQTMSML
jgi:hypothetical protein